MTDRAAELNVMLADPTVKVLELDAGTYEVASSVLVPPGKGIVGKGRAATVIKALPGFSRHVAYNTVVMAQGGIGSRFADLTIDGAKVGNGLGTSERIVGLLLSIVRDFAVDRVDVRNCSGYGHYAGGDAQSFTAPGSGAYRSCRGDNCEIAFEQMFCDGVLLDDCHARGGDGDIFAASWFHPLTGSKNIIYRGCSGKGKASAGIEITANVHPQSNIRIIDTDIEMTTAGIAFVANGVMWTTDVLIRGSRLVSQTYLGMNPSYAKGRISDSFISGKSIGAALNNSSFDFRDCDVTGWNDGGGSAYGISGGDKVNFDGGSITATSASGGHPTSANVVVTPGTRISPFGGGYFFRRILPGNQGNNGTAPIVIGQPYGSRETWSFPVQKGRSYMVEIAGTVQASASTGGIAIGVRATGTVPGPVGRPRGAMRLGAAAFPIAAAGGIGAPGSFASLATVAIADSDVTLDGIFSFTATASGTVSIEIAATVAGVQALIGDGSTLIVEEI